MYNKLSSKFDIFSNIKILFINTLLISDIFNVYLINFSSYFFPIFYARETASHNKLLIA